ncbi:MAG TPA: hypothetical protein VGW75_11375 [Solirubrobacteraceae bacterium]|jgi:hypothetical protein|nr:hypothetical protein [Solirubrobacteraceae bacterium]
MVVLDGRLPALAPYVDEQVDEAAARRSLREQIARLERQLADAVVASFPQTRLDLRPRAGGGGPRMLSLAELEAERDALQERLRQARGVLERRGAEVERNRILLERMLLEPKRYKFARMHRADVDMGGCGAWQVRPRLGLVGMLMGWWQVKLSSGCPLAA